MLIPVTIYTRHVVVWTETQFGLLPDSACDAVTGDTGKHWYLLLTGSYITLTCYIPDLFLSVSGNLYVAGRHTQTSHNLGSFWV